MILRGLLVDGRPEAPTALFRDGLRIYPLSVAAHPPEMEFNSVPGRSFNTIHANDFDFYEELAEVIAREPVDFPDAELRGLAASIGPQGPSVRARSADARHPGRGGRRRERDGRAIAFNTRDPEAYLYESSAWKTAFIGGDYQWLVNGGIGGRNLDARSLFFYLATVNTPAMAIKMVGLGSQYAYANQDSNGERARRRQGLPATDPRRRARQRLLVDRRLRPTDPLGAPDLAALPEQEQPA